MIKSPLIDKLATVVRLPSFVSVVITAILFAPGAIKDLLLYETNDDTAIIALLSGKTGLTPTPDSIFMAYPLGKVLVGLYSFNSAIPWYGIFLYACLFTAFFLCCRLIFKVTSTPLNRFCYVAAISFFYLYTLYRLNFAAVSLFLWCMTVSSIALANLNRERANAGCMGYGLLLGISYLIRPDLLIIALPLSLPLIATFFIPGCHKRLWYVLVPLLMIIAVSSIFDQSVHSSATYSQFQDFNKVRSDFLDTSRSSWTDRTPEALRQNGWSEEDYSVLHHWWLHDETIFNTSSIRAFLDNNGVKTSMFSFETGYLQIRQVLLYLAILLISLASTAIAEKSAFHSSDMPRPVQNIIRIAILFSFSFLVALVFVRFPPRIAIPSFAYLLITGLLFRRHIISTSVYVRRPSILFTCATLLTMVIGFQCYKEIRTFAKYLKTEKYFRKAAFAGLKGKSSQEPIFISTNVPAVWDRVNPLRESKDIPQYIRMPMGWLTGSPAYMAFLQKYGFGDRKTVVSKMVDNPRAVLYFWDSEMDPAENYMPTFVKHLNQQYGKFFPNRSLELRMIEDRRVSDNRGRLTGFAFFRIISIPQ